MAAINSIDISEFTSDIKVTVKIIGVNKFAWKCRVAEWLIRLAGFVLGCEIEVA